MRILLADDHQIIRDGLRALIDRQHDMKVVAEASDGRRAAELVEKMNPDVVVMDIGMPHLNGIEATRQIVAKQAHCKVIALSMHSDKRFVREMLKAGASGYLLKDCAFDELIGAIRAVRRGRPYLSSAISASVLQNNPGREALKKDLDACVLTDRQREVLQLLAEGYTTKQIALRLKVGVKTVETHRQQIMKRLDLHTIADLTKYAVRAGLTSLES